MVDCENNRLKDAIVCLDHESTWQKHVHSKSKSTLNGLRQILQRPGERQEWQPKQSGSIQPHDTDQPALPVRKHYFSPNRFYCVETICAPCGVVIAWTKFDKAESPSNILDWLKAVYPNQEDRPSYICIDKACQVVRTALQKKRVWNEWKQTTRFIVDSYHYINHKADDFLCQKWCNPTPKDGSAPNLIGQKVGKDGKIYDVSLELYIYSGITLYTTLGS